MTRKLLVQTGIWYVLMAAILFVVAGTPAWPGAWAFLIEMVGLGLASAFWLARHDPALLAERLRPPLQGAQTRADRWIMAAFLTLWLVWLLAMGLEARLKGFPHGPTWSAAVGVVLIAVSFWIVDWTFWANSYAAPVVKLQSERQHRVVDTGPYRWVRHPMYAGSLPMLIGIPLLLGTWRGLIWVVPMSALLILRIALEERFLRANLAGYADYAARVRYRLVPLLW
jgi:protein-S-isoprenylcysteine O-methyltransferase Ste14